MQTVENFVDKSAWGAGPWQDEPDKLQWRDEATGLPCLIVRHPSGGHLCGYVGVSADHPYFGKGYDLVDVDVHGGLTFADRCQSDGRICHVVESGEDDNVWWLGFDCAHCWDLSPGFQSTLRAYGLPPRPTDLEDEYRTLDYVRQQCVLLAGQLAAAIGK